MVITKARKLRGLTLIVLIRKKTLEFISEIQNMIDNNPTKWIRSIARDMDVSEISSGR